jgi:hypothetical protein
MTEENTAAKKQYLFCEKQDRAKKNILEERHALIKKKLEFSSYI